MADLLLHSLAEFYDPIFELIRAQAPKGILEIGSETGRFSNDLLAFCDEQGIVLSVIEPKPAQQLITEALCTDTLQLIVGTSLPYLEEHGCPADFVLIDGDHNYFTVLHELRLIAASWKQRGVDGTILLHDVGFPAGRRDSYYAPEQIPEEYLHEHDYERGVTLESSELVPGGFSGAGHFAWAKHQGGPRNGVLTAVEDFRAEYPGFDYYQIDAVFGLGGLALQGSENKKRLEAVFERYDTQLVKALERNRLELYLRVLELQHQLTS